MKNIDPKSIIILLLLFVIAWFAYISKNEELPTTKNQNQDSQSEIKRQINIENGDNASMCAAIYALTEDTYSGIATELLFFKNLIDKDEDEIHELINSFYTVAIEFYKNSGESEESAKHLANYTIMEDISFLKGLKVDGNYPLACESILNDINSSATSGNIVDSTQ
jgi:hypothetical protein